MDAHELRETFLRFFEERGHRRMPSAPVVPADDPTLLFTSAGMVQFKPYFMGQAKAPHNRLASVQKCFRTSDIESVGDTSHLTFFEMLGNFSIADYFKAQIIPWAWEFVTEVLHLQKERLWAAVYLDDDEAYNEWLKAGVPAERIVRYGEEENYWFSGDVGPCGPCSEIYYDFGKQFGCAECEPNHDCGRFLEIWNLVFMSFYCDGDSKTPLPTNNVDTGSGLERVSSVLLYEDPGWDKDRLPSVYDTDLFRPLITEIRRIYGARYGQSPEVDRSIRVIAEHVRAATFLIADGITPSNEGRGYVLRRILRRAVYHAHRLVSNVMALADLAREVVQQMYEAYPELRTQAGGIVRWIEDEERRFTETLGRGHSAVEALVSMRDYYRDFFARVPLGKWAADETQLEHLWSSSEVPEPVKLSVLKPFREVLGPKPWLATKEQLNWAKTTEMSMTGETEFILWDTFGFPPELTHELAENAGLKVHPAARADFQALMQQQRERARADAALKAEAASATADALAGEMLGATDVRFVGYESLETRGKVVALLSPEPELTAFDHIEAPGAVEIILNETPFYPEGGGQVGDRGEISGPRGVVRVETTYRVREHTIVHSGRVVEGRVSRGETVMASVDPQHRADTMRNHTATHLLHAALRKVLGTHVRQAGSLVGPDHIRFDFTHTAAVTPEELAEVSRLVNEKVRQNIPVSTRITSFDEAISEGVLAFFGDKYGAEVRVVEVNSVVPRFSAELCGGTHCHATGQVGSIIITAESSIGSGMRRIEALTGRAAEEHVREQANALAEIARKVGAPKGAIMAKIDSLVAEQETLRKRVERLERSLASAPATGKLMDGATSVDGVQVLATEVEAPSMDALRYVSDSLRKELTSGVAVLAAKVEGRPQFVAIVSGDLIERGVHAGNLLKRVATEAGGGGGGRPDMAQGGGKDISKIGQALGIVHDAVRQMLGGD